MLISEEYKRLQVKAHEDKPHWGRQAEANSDNILGICRLNGFDSLLDYGCGKERLRKKLEPHGIKVAGYGPGIPGLDTPPEPSEFVVCFDVLEHVEPEYVDNVLDDLKRLVLKFGVITISIIPANTTLADGSNAHRTIRPRDWWLERLASRFRVVMLLDEGHVFAVAVEPL